MILHCSTKLAAKLKSSDFSGHASAPGEGSFGSWHGHLATFDRRQCLFFCHDATRFMLVFPGAKKSEFSGLAELHRSLFAAVLEFQGLPRNRINAALLAMGPVTLNNTTDRSVMGSIRTGIQEFEYGLWHRVPKVMDLHPISASAYLNDRPTNIKGKCVWPRDQIQCSIEALGA